MRCVAAHVEDAGRRDRRAHEVGRYAGKCPTAARRGNGCWALLQAAGGRRDLAIRLLAARGQLACAWAPANAGAPRMACTAARSRRVAVRRRCKGFRRHPRCGPRGWRNSPHPQLACSPSLFQRPCCQVRLGNPWKVSQNASEVKVLKHDSVSSNCFETGRRFSIHNRGGIKLSIKTNH